MPATHSHSEKSDSAYVTPSTNVLLALSIILAGSMVTMNPLLTMASVTVIALATLLLWRRSEVPILLFCVTYQWLQVAGKVFYADILGATVVSIDTYRSNNAERAIWLSLAALLCLTIGMRLALLGWRKLDFSRTAAEGRSVRIPRVFFAYLGATTLSVFGAVLRARFETAGQIVVPFLLLKWVFFYAFAYAVMLRREWRLLLVLAVVFEVVLGLGSYFSGFKTVFFILLLVIPTIAPRLTPRRVILGIVAGFLSFSLALVWMGVRDQYRTYLNQGTKAQATLVPWPDRMAMLGTLVGQLDASDAQVALGQGLQRLAYTDIFARVLSWVPAVQPHQDGALWRAALRNILVPRFLFPGKPVLPSDSELTNHFTGIYFAGALQGTSVSMGYVAESYIDFGVFGMFALVTLLGALWGGIYRFVLSRRGAVQLLGYGLAIAVLLDASQFEIASVKLLGGVITKFLMLAIVLPVPLRMLWRWVTAPKVARLRPALGQERSSNPARVPLV